MEAKNGGNLDRAWIADVSSASEAPAQESVISIPDTRLEISSQNSQTETDLASIDRVSEAPEPSAKTHSGKASTRGVLPRPTSKSKRTVGKNDIQLPDIPGTPNPLGQTSDQRNNIIPLSEKRTVSLPVTPFLELGSPGTSSTHQQVPINSSTEGGSVEMKNVARSVSMPLKNLPLPPPRKSAGPSSGITVLLKSIIPRTSGIASGDDSNTTTKDSDSIPTQTDTEKGEKAHVRDGDEEIPEEEAVCRICFEELSERHGETFKMECSCRGEMALAHKDCALKWFSIKGNRTCDVCGLEVCNLPVTVVRQGNNQPAAPRPVAQIIETHSRVWQDVPVLVMLSMLVYFCFLEQLLVGQMGSGALAISLPFSCVLGLLAAITASNLVEKRFVWLYATCQLALVVCFAHIFYDVVHVESVLSILLAAFVGFGIAMVTSTLIIEYKNWKRRSAARARRVREREGSVSAHAPDLTGSQRPGEQQDHVVLHMEGGGLASLWLRPGDNYHPQANPGHGPAATSAT